MVIPPSQGMNQSITRMNTNEDQSPRNQMMTQYFFTEIHLLAGKLILVVAICSLGGSHANWHHTSNPQQGAAQPTQDEDHTSHKQFTRVPFGSLPGKGQEPLTITMIGAGDNHQPPLDDPRCSKPSRWRQPPRVTSESRSETRTPTLHHNTNIASHVCRYRYINTVELLVGIASPRSKCR